LKINLLIALVRKDLQLFMADRKAMVISFAVPVAIASFMGLVTGNMNDQRPPQKLPVLVADLDGSPVAKAVLERLRQSETVAPRTVTVEQARSEVRSGKASLAVVLPAGFGSAATEAMMGGAKPTVPLLTDPSKSIEAQAVRGTLTQAIMQAVAQSASEGRSNPDSAEPRGDLAFEAKVEPQSAPASDRWSGVAHAFAGMAVQGLLFWSIESAMTIMRERRLGIWKRLRGAPVSSGTLVIGRLVSSAICALTILSVVFGSGALIFHIRVNGSLLGFATIAVAAAIMASAFGLFVAALGKTEQQSRGLATLAVLTMSMLGGAWFPSFLMPDWIQKMSLAIPVRWAVDGFDAMTWRGGSFTAAVPSSLMLMGFAAVFAAVALRRFQYEVVA
jgi:ABC-2 type transport system permease protein